ncbi:MAG: bifunctional (p)ppGpp synthetase/guanosine-3',5'-bis(diphosphate) 3'-pyrophosphohydrolase [Oligoflexales bacterium]
MTQSIVPPEDSSELLFQKLLDATHYLDQYEDTEILLRKAFEIADSRHGPQKRASGEPYILHPLSVALILTELKVDRYTLASAILHDTIEDTDYTFEDLQKDFGNSVSEIVDGVTKIGKMKFRSSQERMAENFRKMLLAMAKDLRVILVKLADRLHNMRTLEFLAPEKRHRMAQETLEIYAPLANRLGVYHIKNELEDLCLKETRTESYRDLKKKVAQQKQIRADKITEIVQILEGQLQEYNFESAHVYGRPKHFYSIYRKMIERKLTFEDIHDLFAFRIIVDTVKDCYEVLGIVHAMWKPMPGRFKDYVAMPKPNMYQSLHTTVIRPNGEVAEIQIRTNEMHQICEMGVAAHWRYKEGSNEKLKSNDQQKFSWLRQMMELQQDIKDPNEFLASVRLDLFDEEIFVFTPKGDVIELRTGSSPIDFAFAIHTDVGLTTVGSKINGRMVPLRTKLHNGDIIEILTSSIPRPNKDWLNFVCTSKARNKIRSFLRSERRDQSLKLGRDLLSAALSKHSLDLDKLIKQQDVQPLINASKESSLDEVCIAIGYGRLSAASVVQRAYAKKLELEQQSQVSLQNPEPVAPRPQSSQTGLLVSGMDDILVNRARCCNPLPGDHVIGFITRGRGVSVHRGSCGKALDLDPARRVPVSWGSPEKAETHTTCIRAVTMDRQGLLAEVSTAISSCGGNVQRANIQVDQSKNGILDFEVMLKNAEQLNQVLNRLEAIPGVIYAERRNTIVDKQISKRKKRT